MSVRPRRSVLYMPGSNSRALEKARTLDADGLILDLEDAVAPDAKIDARRLVAAALADRAGYGERELIVRVNGLDTPWGFEDLAAMATVGADAILLPKIDGADAVRRAVRILDAHGGPADLPVWCMMETARGMLRAEEIADSSARLGGFVMGTSDLAKELACAHTPMRLPMITSIGLCLLAARAVGFDGKTLIHPKQLAAANEAFAPSDAEVAWSRKIIAAHRAAAAEGKGVVVVDGRLVENLHVAMAESVVAMAEAIAARA